MKISIIVPLYYGEKYLNKLISKFKINESRLPAGYELQIIFVKDSMEDIDIQQYRDSELEIVFIQNKQNKGIHYSRTVGVKNATGEYIHMLDQDDEITDDFYLSFIGKLEKADVVVCNGIEQKDNYDKMLYRYYFMHYTVKFCYFYTKFSCRIISPGQCLIKKDSIPIEWMENIIKNNGADDAMLWMMMLYDKKVFALNRHVGYIHVNTGNNVSLDSHKMTNSLKEVRDILKKNKMISKNNLKRLDAQLCSKKKSAIVLLIEKLNRKRGE